MIAFWCVFLVVKFVLTNDFHRSWSERIADARMKDECGSMVRKFWHIFL